LWDALVIRQAEATAAGYPPSEQARMRQCVRAAAERAQAADDLLERHPACALTLYREAALLSMAAFVAVSPNGSGVDRLSSPEVLSLFRQAVATGRAPISEAELNWFVEHILDDSLLTIDRPELWRAAEAERAQGIVRKLATLVEPRSVSEIRFERGVRLTGLGLIVCALLVWAAVDFFTRPNLALHKPVTSSGIFPTSTALAGGLTDGVTTGSYGIHTNVSDNPWVQVDLLALFKIDKVKIFNRGDGWFNDGLPMTLQLSEDGLHFTTADTRTTSFGQKTPWIVKGHGKKARYVRVAGSRGKYVSLSELEVFGQAP
jgi:hypothetical protein